MKIKFPVLLLIVVYFVITSPLSFSQSPNFLRSFGFGLNGGINYMISPNRDNVPGFSSQIHLDYHFPIVSQSFSMGIKVSFLLGSISRFNDLYGDSNISSTFSGFVGGPTFNFKSNSNSFVINVLAGNLSYNTKTSSGIILGDNNKYGKIFLLAPSIELDTWITKSLSFDVILSTNFPFNKKFGNYYKHFWKPFYELRAGISFYFLTKLDKDDDGVPDGIDKCPDTPEGEKVNKEGCANSQIDSDSDGVNDAIDKCPNTPINERSLVDTSGCSPSQKDSDGDGINDAIDHCPHTPKSEIDIVNKQGCGPSERDSDFDGVVDSRDKCPNTPKGEKVDKNGCGSSQLDSDNDGIYNNIDKCVKQKETYNFYKDDDGCPDTTEYDNPYLLNQMSSLFKPLSDTLSSVGKSILRGRPYLLYTSYPKTFWIIEVKSPARAKEKALAIKSFLDKLSKEPSRTSIEFYSSKDEKVYLKINSKKAEEIVRKKIGK